MLHILHILEELQYCTMQRVLQSLILSLFSIQSSTNHLFDQRKLFLLNSFTQNLSYIVRNNSKLARALSKHSIDSYKNNECCYFLTLLLTQKKSPFCGTMSIFMVFFFCLFFWRWGWNSFI